MFSKCLAKTATFVSLSFENQYVTYVLMSESLSY